MLGNPKDKSHHFILAQFSTQLKELCPLFPWVIFPFWRKRNAGIGKLSLSFTRIKKKTNPQKNLFLFVRTFASGHILRFFLMSQSSSKSQKTLRWEFLLLGELFTSITTARVLLPRNYMLALTVSTCLITVHTHSLSQLLTAALERMVKITSFLKRIFGV